MSSYSYIASPYSAKKEDGSLDLEMMESRFKIVRDFTAHMLNQKHFVYSPIVHCHPLAIAHELPRSFEFWQHYNRAMIDQADTLFVLEIPGWEDSVGVKGEIEYAGIIQIPVVHFDLDYKVTRTYLPFKS